MKKISVRLFGVGLVACASVVSGAFSGCASDDAGIPPKPPKDAAPDKSVADSPSGDTSNEASTKETSTDSPSDSPMDSLDSPADSPAEAATSCAVLGLCPTLDQIWRIIPKKGEPAECATQTNGACPQRGGTWGNDIVKGFVTGPINNDCRVRAILYPTWLGGLLDDAAVNAISPQLIGYALSFMGCPVTSGADGGAEAGVGDAGVPPLGFISTSIDNVPLTSADLKLITYYWFQAIQAALAAEVAEPPASAGLTPAQITMISDRLACEISKEPAQVPSCSYSHPLCTAEAGPPDAGPMDSGCD
jgi:hypothetical protein